VIMRVVGVVVRLSGRPIVDRLLANRSWSHRRRITETPNETATRLSARRDRDGQRRRSGDYFEVEGRYFPQA